MSRVRKPRHKSLNSRCSSKQGERWRWKMQREVRMDWSSGYVYTYTPVVYAIERKERMNYENEANIRLCWVLYVPGAQCFVIKSSKIYFFKKKPVHPFKFVYRLNYHKSRLSFSSIIKQPFWSTSIFFNIFSIFIFICAALLLYMLKL